MNMKRPANATLLGLAIGDALGMPFETNKDSIHPKLADWTMSTYVEGNYHKLPPGHYTDDTEMAAALAESLVDTKGWYSRVAAAEHYRQWSLGAPTGMGTSTRTAMNRLVDGIPAHLSGVMFDHPDKVGNGTAMRCAPLGVVNKPGRDSDLLYSCRDDARITHDHPVAVDASYAVALAISQILETSGSFNYGTILRRLPKESLIADAIEKAFQCIFDRVQDEEAMNILGRRGNAIQTVGSAFYFCGMYCASDFDFALDRAIRAGGDTDTRGAIVGAIMGTMKGRDRIPEHLIDGLNNAQYIMDLDDKLIALRDGAEA